MLIILVNESHQIFNKRLLHHCLKSQQPINLFRMPQKQLQNTWITTDTGNWKYLRPERSGKTNHRFYNTADTLKSGELVSQELDSCPARKIIFIRIFFQSSTTTTGHSLTERQSFESKNVR